MAKNRKPKQSGKPASISKGGGDPLPVRVPERFLPFASLHEDTFEDLCIDLVETQAGIVRAEGKNKRKSKQFGVDVEGFDTAQNPVLVLQAKRYQQIRPGNITSWGDDFLNNWQGHWTGKGVQRFVLAVTVELNNDALNAVIAQEAARFAAIGITYEVWGLQQLTSLMVARAPHRIDTYFRYGGWREAVTGLAPDPGAYAMAPAKAAAPQPTTIIEDLSSTASRAIAERYGQAQAQALESALERFREGRHQPLEALIRQLKQDAVGFAALGNDVKARLLRAEATLAIVRLDTAAARKAMEEARLFHEPPDRVGEAQLLRLEGNSDAAIALLDAPATRFEAELLLALILEQQGPQAMFDRLAVLSAADTAEILRLRGVAHFLAGAEGDALTAIDAAVAAAPQNFAGLIASAIIRFGLSLSPKAPRQFGSFPNPVHPGLAREDDRARTWRREAFSIFQRLAQSVDRPAIDIAIWTIATQLMGKDTAQNGLQALRDLLHQTPEPPEAMLWALAFGVKFNTKGAHKRLLQRLEAGSSRSLDLAALIALHGAHNRRKAALKELDRFGPQFTHPIDQEQIGYWRQHLSDDAGDATAFRDALGALRRSNDPGPLMAFLSHSAAPEQLLGATEQLAIAGFLPQIDALRAPLLALKTADGIELAARAAVAAGDGVGASTILAEAAAFYPAGQLPHRMRMLEANAALLRGEVGTAVRLLESAEADDFTRLQIGKIRALAGDIRGARRVLGGLSGTVALPSREALPLAGMLQQDAPDVARRLLEAITPEELAQEAPIEGYALATALGSAQVAQILAPQFFAAARSDGTSAVLRLDSVEDFLAMVRQRDETLELLRKQWLTGQFPAHLVLDHQPRAFLMVAHGRSSDDDDFAMDWPMLVRAGLPRHEPIPISGKSLHLDITAIILAERLGLLEKLEALGPVRIPAVLPQALAYLLQNTNAHAAPQARAIEEVLAALASGRMEMVESVGAADGMLEVPPPSADSPITPVFAGLVAQASEFGPALAGFLHPFIDRVADVTALVVERLVLRDADAVALAQAGVLADLLALGKVAVLGSDEKSLRTWLGSCRAEMERRATLERARKTASERLLEGSWHQLVLRPGTTIEDGPFGQSGPLAYCLLTLVQESQDAVTWVEDRAASAAKLVGTSPNLDVFDILSALVAAGQLSEPERCAAELKLIAMGYGNLPYDTDQLLSLVQGAAVADGRLVETPALASVRRHFALQLDRLRFASANIRMASSDGEQNEPRFGAWHMHLASKLLTELFADATLPMDQLVARANWIWENSNADQAGFLPIMGTPNDASRRTLVRASLDRLITSVLQLQVPGANIERACRERYAAWLFGHVVEPTLQHNAPFADEVMAEVAQAFAGVIVRRENEETPGLARASRTIVLRAIDPMPEPWRSRLLQVPVLAERINLPKGGSVVLRDDVSFTASEFYDAISAAFSAGEGKARTNAGIEAVFSVDVDGLVITLDGTRLHLADAQIGLAQLKPEDRRRSFDGQVKTLDLLPEEIEPLWQELEQQPFQARMAILGAREQNSYVARLGRLSAELQNEGNIDHDLLTPPPPASLLRFLRLAPDAGAADLPSAFTRIAAAFDVFEALKRTAGLPILLSDRDEAQLGKAIMEIDKGETHHAPSPLYGLKSALALRNESANTLNAAIADVLGALENAGGLFVATLRWSARRVRDDEAWQALAPEMRRALLWLHADLLTAHLVVGRAEPSESAEIFDRLDRFGIFELLNELDRDVEADAGFETSIGLRVWVCGLLCRDAPPGVFHDELLIRMRALAAYEHNGGWVPQVVPLARPDYPPFGTLAEAIAALLAAGVLTVDTIADSRTPVELLTRFVQEGTELQTADVGAMLPLFRIRDVPQDLIAPVLGVADRFQPFARVAINTPVYDMWLSVTASLYGRLGDAETFFVQLQPRIAAARALTGQAAHDAFGSLAEAAFHFALAHAGDGVARLTILLNTLDRMASEGDDLATGVRQILAGMVPLIPPEHGTAIWDMLLRWRRL